MTDRVTFTTIFNQMCSDIKECKNNFNSDNTCRIFDSIISWMATGIFGLIILFSILSVMIKYKTLFLIISTSGGLIFSSIRYFRMRKIRKDQFMQHFYDKITYSTHYSDRNNEKVKLKKVLNILHRTKHMTFVTIREFITSRNDVLYKIVKYENKYNLEAMILNKQFCHFTLNSPTKYCSFHDCTHNNSISFYLEKDILLYNTVNEMLYD